MKLTNSLALALTLIAFVLRLAYAKTSHPFIDEFTTVLAAQTILTRGVPVLPSGLFYEHGLLFSYLDAPFVALAGHPPIFIIARLPSIIIGTALIPLLYSLGRRWFSPWVGLGAALLLTLSPEAIVWASRARMYALTQLLILGLVYFAFAGIKCRSNHYVTLFRWLMLLTLLAALLTQLAAILFVPALLVAMFVVQWLCTSPENRRLSWDVLPIKWQEWVGLGSVIGLGLLIKRLGQPLGTAKLGSEAAGNALGALWNTVAYQAGLVINYTETMKFLGRQFGVPHNIWLAIIALIGLTAFIIIAYQDRQTLQRNLPYIFICLIFGLTVLEMITLLKPFRRNPRYLVMAMPIFYLIVSAGLAYVHHLIRSLRIGTSQKHTPTPYSLLPTPYFLLLTPFLALHANGLWQSLNVTYKTPEPAYESAFQFVADQHTPEDAILTMNPSAAALYLDQVDYFAMQSDADQFLLNRDTEPIDRWLGKPAITTTVALNRVLNEHSVAWFVIDTIRLPVYYQSDWLAFLDTQMELAWANDNALVYRTRPDRILLPDHPETTVDVNFDNQIRLIGYSAKPAGEAGYNLTLFWEALTQPIVDFTIFIHIRDMAGNRVTQNDGQPLSGTYPTSRWQVGEAIIDPYEILLPTELTASEYQIWVGMYQLETLERLPIIGDTSGENAALLGGLTHE